MNARSVFCFSFIVTLIAVLAFHLFHLCIKENFGENEHYKIIIGIISARENFVQRETLRKTWLNFLRDKSARKDIALYRFIVGKHGCDIPAADRINPYQCEWDRYIQTNQDVEMIAYQIRENSTFTLQREPIGLDFEVMHPIIITRLGIVKFGKGFETEVRVSIFDRITKAEVISAIFHRDMELKNGFLFKSVEGFLLPKEFKGTIVVDGNGQEFLIAKSNESCLINDGGGQIKFEKIIRYAQFSGFFPMDVMKSISYCSVLASTFVYKPHGMEGLKPGISVKNVKARLNRINFRKKKLKEETDLLNKENMVHRDILFVNVTDVYRNIPSKLLAFYTWVEDHFDFNFTMKTDDDCYIDIFKILEMLETERLKTDGKSWYGNFRIDWPLDKFGKWAEHEYTSSFYPAFACGSGYLLSRDIVRWISLNSIYLHSYQGEDVSTGIWLSAIGPKIINDRRWQCYQICNENMFSLPNNDPKELLSLYSNHALCGNPCNCTL